MDVHWTEEPIRHPQGIIVGCSHDQEWLLPWWWMHFRMHNELPVTFFDFGAISPKAKEWCQRRGEVKTPPNQAIESLIAGKEAVPPPLVTLWEEHLRKDLWQARPAWFKKPFACLNSPYEKSLWIDLDAQVRKSVAPLFAYCDNPQSLSLVEEPPSVQEQHRKEGYLVEGETEYNTGVIAFKRGAPLIQEWAQFCLERNSRLRGDQEAFARLLFEQRTKLLKAMPPACNARITLIADTPDPTIVHWVGIGKDFIRGLMLQLAMKGYMNFSLD